MIKLNNKAEIEFTLNTAHKGDVLDLIKTLPNESIHSVITSPPY